MEPVLSIVALAVAFPWFTSEVKTVATQVEVEARAVVLDGLPKSQAQRVLAADEDGELFLLEGGSEPRVFSVSINGDVEEHGTLSQPVTGINAAAVGRGGDLWVLRVNTRQVRVFEGGEEVALPPVHWMVTGVAVANDDPIVSLGASRVVRMPTKVLATGEGATPFEDEELPPFLARLVGDRWSMLGPPRSDEEAARYQGIRARETWLLGAPDGAVTLARRTAYDVVSYSKTGKRRGRISVNDGEIQREEVALSDLLDEGKENTSVRMSDDQIDEATEKLSGKTMRARSTLAGIATAPDGSLMVVSYGKEGSSGRIVLDRHQSASASTVRTVLAKVPEGSVRVVGAKEGLVLWPARLDSKIYVVPWLLLEEAEVWSDAEDVVLE